MIVFNFNKNWRGLVYMKLVWWLPGGRKRIKVMQIHDREVSHIPVLFIAIKSYNNEKK